MVPRNTARRVCLRYQWVTNVRGLAAGAKVAGMTEQLKPLRDPALMLQKALQEWGGHEDLWVFGYGSLIWRPDFEFAERRPAKVHGWHRAKEDVEPHQPRHAR